MPILPMSDTRRALARRVITALEAGDVEKARQLIGTLYGRSGRGLTAVAKFAVLSVNVALDEGDVPRALRLARLLVQLRVRSA